MQMRSIGSNPQPRHLVSSILRRLIMNETAEASRGGDKGTGGSELQGFRS